MKELLISSCYMDNVLPVALKYGNEVFGDKLDLLTRWFKPTPTSFNTRMVYPNNFPSFIEKDR